MRNVRRVSLSVLTAMCFAALGFAGTGHASSSYIDLDVEGNPIPLVEPPAFGPPTYDAQPTDEVPDFPEETSLPEVADEPLPERTAGTLTQAHQLHGVCKGRTDNPHNSKHYPGYILVSSRTECTHTHGVSVTIDLYREVFGALYFLDRGFTSGTRLAQANARWDCPKGSKFKFVGKGSHTAVTHAPGDTRNEQVETCT